MAEPRELGAEDCERLLRAGVVGRAAVCTPSGPHIVPLNYTVFESSIVFTTTPYSVLGTYGRNAQIAFEVDTFDPERRAGWSVVARGRGDVVMDPVESREIRTDWPPRPWADGHRSMLFRLRWTELSGRRIGTAATQEQSERDAAAADEVDLRPTVGAG